MIKADIIEEELREKIVSLAKHLWHKEYVHGDMGPDTFDCAGFVWYVYNTVLGINIFEEGYGKSTTTKIMTSKIGVVTIYNENKIKDISSLKKGDIILFHRQSLKDSEPLPNNKYPGHCGIYLGDNRFIHASSKKKRIIINDFSKSKYWCNVLVGSKDVISSYKVLKK